MSGLYAFQPRKLTFLGFTNRLTTFRSQSSGAGTMEDYSDFVDRSIPTDNELTPPSWHRDGPMPTISDSLFSLIILVYVSVIFIFMFFAFWRVILHCDPINVTSDMKRILD